MYVNRTLIGATVGVQPFGGEGLSGTGPKAGGPFYLARLDGGRSAHRFEPDAVAGREAHGVATTGIAALRSALANDATLAADARARLDAVCVQCEAAAVMLTTMRLPGPTGETNQLRLRPRDVIACRADDPVDAAAQVIACVALDRRPRMRRASLPPSLHGFVDDWDDDVASIDALDAVLVALTDNARVRTNQACAARPGPIVAVMTWTRDTPPVLHLWRLTREFAESVNTAAAGGNASLMTLVES